VVLDFQARFQLPQVCPFKRLHFDRAPDVQRRVRPILLQVWSRFMSLEDLDGIADQSYDVLLDVFHLFLSSVDSIHNPRACQWRHHEFTIPQALLTGLQPT
jgi:hypothetical protein